MTSSIFLPLITSSTSTSTSNANIYAYAAMLNALDTTTTFPLVQNLRLRNPSASTSLKELPVPLLAPEEANGQRASMVDSEQRTDTVEFGGEDFEDDEGEGEAKVRCAARTSTIASGVNDPI
ncbi:hypothetical protein AJ78_00059 [Emergomyces pasteurianus Ep9510]|uniref:Uncharacterized protein n=1 Tax=Emergomyces pasteurianus Ep9510 TaxID=1447872 RepID=A0A1J9QIL4_9EURO|nr:hypothetical protein AJ78_00059 [Emergomyces pasteurianus Ep9510]